VVGVLSFRQAAPAPDCFDEGDGRGRHPGMRLKCSSRGRSSNQRPCRRSKIGAPARSEKRTRQLNASRTASAGGPLTEQYHRFDKSIGPQAPVLSARRLDQAIAGSARKETTGGLLTGESRQTGKELDCLLAGHPRRAAAGRRTPSSPVNAPPCRGASSKVRALRPEPPALHP